jgi:hypothetical protein
MTRNELIRLRRQMQRRIQDVVAERRSAADQRATAGAGQDVQASKAA